jgi:hypothetical protein
MAYVNADNQGWKNGEASIEILYGPLCRWSWQMELYFMWERFMTKPLVDKGILDELVDCPTPWPCFKLRFERKF